MARSLYIEAKIPTGTALSLEVELRAHRLVGIHMPAAWDAAAISFASCIVDDNRKGFVAAQPFDPVKDSAGAEISITVAANTYVVFTPAHRDALSGLGRVKIRSGLVGAAVNQTADRQIILVTEPRDSMS